MSKKIAVVALIIGVGLGLFMGLRRMMMMAQPAQPPGGLVAVSAAGTPLAPLADAAATPLPENMVQQQVDDMTVTLALDPYPPTSFNPADFEVTLTDANGQAIPDATIQLDLTMPTMWMPPNQFTLPPTTAGKYFATGQFTMRGFWRIEVIITRAAQTQSVFFEVWL